MGSLNDKIIRLEAKKFNKKRTKKLPVGLTCQLLAKQGLTPNTFDVLFEVSDWWYYHNSFKEKTVVLVATQDSDFEAALVKASDIKIGSAIYEIDTRDVRPPDGEKPHWFISGTMNIELYG